MLPYATPAIAAQLDPHEERERDTLRTRVRQQLGPPTKAGARIALAICEVEAGLRSPLQLEQRCHQTCGPSCRSGLTAQNRHRDDLIETVGTESAEGEVRQRSYV
jgi:hypothetical protein